MADYEFTDSQNQVFQKLARSLRAFGIQFGVFAVLLLFLGLEFVIRGEQATADAYTSVAAGVGMMFLGGLVALICLRLLKPVRQFTEIVSTEGNDISALMSGLDRLAYAHRTLRLILVLLFIGSALAVYRVLT